MSRPTSSMGEARYTFAANWLLRVVLQYDHASGDSSNPNTFNRFDTLFAAAANTTRSASMDRCLADRAGSFALTRVRDRSGQSGNFAGHQIEGRLRYWVVPDATLLETGAAYL